MVVGYFKNELSWRSKWHLSKHRYLELVHFCAQYDEWKQKLKEITVLHSSLGGVGAGCNGRSVEWTDKTAEHAAEIAELREKIELIEKTAYEAEPSLSKYIVISVTKEIAFPALNARMDIPCGKEMFYDRRRKFFWLLDQRR